jgi:multiple sugar transport system permease protein
VDVHDLDLLPRFFYDESILFSKFAEAKYNEDIIAYNDATSTRTRNFRAVAMATEHREELLEDWSEFIAQSEMPISWFLTGFGPTKEGKIIQRNERAFRQYVSKLCDNELERFEEIFDETIESWFFLKFPPERLLDRKYQLNDSPLNRAFYDFKKSLPLEDRIYVSCDAAFERYLKLMQKGEEVDLDVLPVRSNGKAWAAFVRNYLHLQFVKIDHSFMSAWSQFLKSSYGTIEQLNKIYGSDYSDFGLVEMPEDRMTTSAALTDYQKFVADQQSCPLEALSVDTPEIRWRAFIEKKYGFLSAASEAHGRDYESFEKISMPQLELDTDFMGHNISELRRYFAFNNYLMVMEYILFYGSGIMNTLIYCLASIALALLVNPLAAYALSRYSLPGQYKILLFLIATMAFPAVVTMIPNFLLLRDLGLLNTFAALLLPTMANGYSIFLLKGFFDSLPKELFEAADLDGANEWQKFWIITMNLSKPVLAVIALGAFNGAYANFMYAFIMCQDRDMWTLTVWLYQLQQFSSQGVVFASLMIAAVPTLTVFILCQKIILRGIVVPTEK